MSERPPAEQRLQWRADLRDDGTPNPNCIISQCWGYTVVKHRVQDAARYETWRTNRDKEGRRGRDVWPDYMGTSDTGEAAKALAEWDSINRGRTK